MFSSKTFLNSAAQFSYQSGFFYQSKVIVPVELSLSSSSTRNSFHYSYIRFSCSESTPIMAPREATGNFPDQYLTFDYDTVPMGVGQQHDPTPAAPNDNDQQQQLQQHTPNALNHVGHGFNSERPPSEEARALLAASLLEAVDPLSIDPTGDQPSTMMDVGGHQRTIQSPLLHSTVESPLARISNASSPLPINSLGSDHSTSPLSTGSSYFNSNTAPNSPQLFFGGNATTTNVRDSNRLLHVQSVLDAAGSMESDDEDDDDHIPPLEGTFESGLSSSAFLDSSGHVVSEEDESKAFSVHDQANNLSDTSSVESSGSLRMIYRNTAFDGDDPQSPVLRSDSGDMDTSPQSPVSPNTIMLSFGPNTTVADLKYFAERGCIVALLQALTTPRLVTLGTRMLADYAKMSHRRVAVASNRRILEFVERTMLEVSEQADWLGREYAVETVRSLTATEESDHHLMGKQGLLETLSVVARGGPYVTHVEESGARCTVPLASEKARLHACIAIMNLSCGKVNKIEIAKVPDVLEAMRDVMVNSADEARLKATTCIKNLSNADANDAALLGTPGLLEALGHVASVTCSPETGATPCTTNACLALMNLSISKGNKHKVFRTPGVMESLMIVLERTTAQGSSTEARIKACSALSNLAIGYDNKIPMFNYPGFVDSILNVIQTDTGEARTKACSILWSFAAEMKNQEPVVARGDILPVLVQVAEEDATTEARFKCVAALTLLAESIGNAIHLLEAGALVPLMEILHEAGSDPTQWKGQTASWCVGFLMNIAQSDEAVPALREAGVVELLAPLLTLDHYQSLKAAMAVTFCCRYDEGDECYDLLRKTENVIPKIISLLHNTLSGRGGNGYKYGVFTLRSSIGCIDALASGPEFMKERIATGPVFESLLRVVHDYCVDGGTPGAIVGGGRDDALSATLAVRTLQSLTGHLIPVVGSSTFPFGQSLEGRLIVALESFETSPYHPEIRDETRRLATDAKIRIQGGRKAVRTLGDTCHLVQDADDMDIGDVASMASNCCGFHILPGFGEDFLRALALPSLSKDPTANAITSTPSIVEKDSDDEPPIRTFLLADSKTGRRFVVPSDPFGGRQFHDARVWCYRRGRFCTVGEEADPTYIWSTELQQAYEAALTSQLDTNTNMPPCDSSAGCGSTRGR
jgi:hypothetical protein